MSCTITNLLGRRFGRWKVHSLSYIELRGGYWNCECDCGSFDAINASSLLCGNSRSCGCIKNLNFKKGEAAFRMLIYAYKASAKRRKYQFKLGIEECRVLFLGNCYYCNTSPKRIFKTPGLNGGFIYNGIDRIDNTKDYIIDNCVSCCKRCNFAKQSMTIIEFKKWIRNVYKNLNIRKFSIS